MSGDSVGNIEHWAAVAATLVDLAKRDLPPHISEAEQVEAYLGLKRIAADYRGAVADRDALSVMLKRLLNVALVDGYGETVRDEAEALLARIEGGQR